MEQTVQDQIAALVGEFGEDTVRQAAELLLQAKTRQIPAEYYGIIDPKRLYDTIYQLDVAISTVDAAGKAKEASYEVKRDLVKRKPQYEAALELKAAEAYMNVKGEGKNAVGVVDGVEMPLGNEEQRKAYQRLYSKMERERLAQLEGELQQVELDVIAKTDAWFTAKEQVDTLRAKAHLQAALLMFLAGRG
jgi:hypothetical protein